MAHGWLSFPRTTAESSLSCLLCRPLFPAVSWIFSLGSTANTLLPLSSPSFRQFNLQPFSSLASSPVFQMARPTLGTSSITEFYFFFPTSSLDLYLYFYCPHSLTFLLIYWVCPSYIWVSVNVLKQYFILTIFLSEFSSDPFLSDKSTSNSLSGHSKTSLFSPVNLLHFVSHMPAPFHSQVLC